MQAPLKAWGEMGQPLPYWDHHGVSVHLPTWVETMGWATRDPKVIARMKTGYPRFFYHRIVVELTNRVRSKIEQAGLSSLPGNVGGPDFSALLFPCLRYADMFVEYLQRDTAERGHESGAECYFLSVQDAEEKFVQTRLAARSVQWHKFELAAVLFTGADENLSRAKAFWQHTGYGVGSRYAEICLEALGALNVERLPIPLAQLVPNNNGEAHLFNNEDSRKNEKVSPENGTTADLSIGELCTRLRLEQGAAAKQTLHRRLASLNTPSSTSCTPELPVADDDVFLYQTGMTALTELTGALKITTPFPSAPMVAFGFLYVDSFKTIERIHSWPNILYPSASTSDLDSLECYLSTGNAISGLVLEVPGNPLVRSPDLHRLRRLADKHNFPIIIDDTVGTPINVDVMPFADAVASSLTKMFSGGCNAMGGALVLNPSKPFHERLKRVLCERYIDAYYPAEAEIMAQNSADFSARVLAASANAEMVVGVLRASSVVEHVFYPSGSETQALYDSYRRPEGRYGFLLSVNFMKPAAAMAFLDALETAKGPSLGTNFTLACAHTIIAHYASREMDWAAKYGVGEYLVRISVGLEDPGELRKTVERALHAAENANGTG